jgi:hypothetical protein
MGSLNVTDIKPGMILAQPITNFQGVLLLPQGTKLTERHINLMKSWGVTGAEIEGESRKETSELGSLDERQQKLLEERIKRRFPQEAPDPVNAELKRLAVKVMIANFGKR